MVVAIVIVLLAGAGIAYVLLDPFGSDPPVTGDGGDFQGGASALVYADFDEVKDLHRRDLHTGQDSIVDVLPHSGNTTASFGSSWLAIEVPEEDAGQSKPILYIFDPESDVTHRLGVLVEPKFSPDGRRLAALRPTDESLCGPVRCSGDKVAVVIDVDDPDSKTELGDPGRFVLRGWAGDHLMVSMRIAGGDQIIQSISPSGETAEIPFGHKDYWGASPDGKYVIQSALGGTLFHEFSGGRVVGEGPPIGIPPNTVLGSGTWSHDSSRVAAFAIGRGGELELVTFGPADPEPRTLANGGQSASGDVMWSPGGDELVFSRFTGTELEAVDCALNEPEACEVLFSWTRGISLLRLE
jgi:hypothetical protein